MNHITTGNHTQFIDSLFIGYANQYKYIKNHIAGDPSAVIINIYDKQDTEKQIARMTDSCNVIFDGAIHIDKVLELLKFLQYIRNEIEKNNKLINFHYD